MHKGPMAVEDLGRKGFEKRKGEGRVEAEGERETMGSREGGEGRGDVVGSNESGPPQVGSSRKEERDGGVRRARATVGTKRKCDCGSNSAATLHGG